MLLSASSASAAGKHPFKETFGGATPPTFTTPASIAVEGSSGDVLVLDAGRAEEDSLTVSATAGQFRLTYEGLTTAATFTGDTSSTGTTAEKKTIKNISGVSGTLTRGEAISGAGIPAGATISKILSPTEIEISAAATASAVGVPLSAEGLPYKITSGVLKQALEDLTSLSEGAITVTGGPGDEAGSKPYLIKFLYRDAAELTLSEGTTPLSGGSGATIETTVQGVNAAIRRFKPDGTPDDFSGLGTNQIDGQRGPGGKTGAECESAPEPSSCDETPQNGLVLAANENNVFSQAQISVDNSAGPNAGDIYVTQSPRRLVSVFSPSGAYLTQITEYAPDETQEVSFAPAFGAGKWTSESTFELGDLPSACSRSSTGAISWDGTSALLLAENVLAALETVCGRNFRVADKATLGLPLLIEFTNTLGNAVQPPLTCTHLSGPGASCAVVTTVPGHSPSLALAEPRGVAVDAAGAFYIGAGELRIDKYAPAASPPANSDSSINFGSVESFATTSIGSGMCNLASGTASTAGSIFAAKCGSGAVEKRDAATGAVAYSFGAARIVAVDPETGNPIIAPASTVASEYEAGVTAPTVARSTLTAEGTIQGIAFSKSAGDVYVSRAGSSTIDVFGPAIFPPEIKPLAASPVSGTEATLRASVNPKDDALTECKFEYGLTTAYGSTVSCAQGVPTDGNFHPASAQVNGLTPETTYHFRLLAANGAGQTQGADREFTTSPTVATEPADPIGDTTATVNGTVNPDGSRFTTCIFEYLTADQYFANLESPTGQAWSGPNAPQSQDCSPAPGSIEPDFSDHPVNAALAGLAKGTTYHFRLLATKGSTTYTGSDRSFTTLGPPIVSETVPLQVDQSSATLQATVDPDGFSTIYRFEWGPTAAYGRSAPAELEPSLGSGTGKVFATAKIAGLQEAGTYHFRIVASNSSGMTTGPDATLETLDGCGFVQNRCLELVSPADKGPLAEAGEILLKSQRLFQPAAFGSKVNYVLNPGLPDSTAGGEVVYQATRGGAGWQSSQLSPPTLAASPVNSNQSGVIRYSSADLGCTYFSSRQPLTEDAPRSTIEAGKENLFLRRPDASFVLLTPRPYADPEATHQLGVAGASADCERVVFFVEGSADFAGLGGGLYEWDHGVLRSISLIPGATGPVPATPGAGFGNYWNAVGTDCAEAGVDHGACVPSDESRVVFTATSQEGTDNGRQAIFLYSGGGEDALDISQKNGGAPHDDLGAFYQTASTDTTKVFFLANYGLAGAPVGPVGPCDGGNGQKASPTAGTGAGCDLYLYDESRPGGERLVDLSAVATPAIEAANEGGAAVAGVLDASDDGSYVYFAARGQLVLGQGDTYAENMAGEGSYNIYLSHEGALSYVGRLAQADWGGNGAQVGIWGSTTRPGWSSRVTPDGRHLLFQSTANVTGYESGGALEAYLFSAPGSGTPDGNVTCVSCRHDGRLSLGRVGQEGLAPLTNNGLAAAPLNPPRRLTDDGSEVFFWSPDALALGAEEGGLNLYEWHDGQVSLLTLGVSDTGQELREGVRRQAAFAGAGADGEDIYLASPRSLEPQDFDQRLDLYDAREGGGFAPAAPPPSACDPLGEGSCQGAGSPAGTASPAPASTGASEGNVHQGGKPAKKHRRHRRHRKHHKHREHKRHHQAKARAGDHRRAGK
ncbi:MAG TPA: fibronectin type III domain-containing protein [Solirubrobacterales bacterium]|nr:fibronectin type III domain-containing protein [Solirubrobacterales bacterium]